MLYLTVMSTLLALDFCLWLQADARVRGLPRARFYRSLVAAFALAQIGFMFRILLWSFVPRHDSNMLIVAGFCLAYAWHLLVIPATLLALAISGLARRLKRAPAPLAELPSDRAFSRRQIIRGAVVAVPPLLAFCGMGLAASELFTFRVRRMTLTLKSLPRALDGITIAHVSDTHVGRFTNDRLLEAIARTSNALDADLTLFTGDLIDIALADLDPAIRFAQQLRGRYGVFLCEGNHDLIEDAHRKTTVFEDATRAAGLRMLLDESASIRVRDVPVQILGGRWQRSAKDRVEQTTQLMRQRDPSAFGIFLTHHPHCWDQSEMPLTLSGHTHGGQLMLNEKIGVGPIMFRYWSGEYRRGDQALVVSNGTGNWFPVRIAAPAELIHLTLRSA